MIIKRFCCSPCNPLKHHMLYSFGFFQRIGKVVKNIPSLFKASSKKSKFDHEPFEHSVFECSSYLSFGS
jgi:hypothetical protein